jgi:hypothetical protein
MGFFFKLEPKFAETYRVIGVGKGPLLALFLIFDRGDGECKGA